MFKPKSEVKEVRKLTTNRNFSYELDGTTLNFNLNLDDIVGVNKFKRLIEIALEDIDKAIQDINKLTSDARNVKSN